MESGLRQHHRSSRFDGSGPKQLRGHISIGSQVLRRLFSPEALSTGRSLEPKVSRGQFRRLVYRF